MGAWIETRNAFDLSQRRILSHPVWVRGLKPEYDRLGYESVESHPVWVRGLKQRLPQILLPMLLVAPRVGAWIETVVETPSTLDNTSHPVWVRGLKPCLTIKSIRARSSHPVWVRGLKPDFTINTVTNTNVAPRVGAWIET